MYTDCSWLVVDDCTCCIQILLISSLRGFYGFFFVYFQCGVVLGMILLFGSAWLTHSSCNLLIKAAMTARRRTYEFLALYTFGPAGKLAVEVR